MCLKNRINRINLLNLFINLKDKTKSIKNKRRKKCTTTVNIVKQGTGFMHFIVKYV